MVKEQTPLMRIDKRKRGTGDVFLINGECVRDTFDQHRLACAQRTIQQQDFTTLELFTDTDTNVEGLVLILRSPAPAGDGFQFHWHHCGNSPEGSSERNTSLKCSRMSEAVIARIPSFCAAKSPA